LVRRRLFRETPACVESQRCKGKKEKKRKCTAVSQSFSEEAAVKPFASYESMLKVVEGAEDLLYDVTDEGRREKGGRSTLLPVGERRTEAGKDSNATAWSSSLILGRLVGAGFIGELE
jgi:hypothetical protein